MSGLRYGSPKAAAQAERWAEFISHTAYRTSCDLSVEKEVFPLFDGEAYLAGETVSALPDDIRARIAAGGIRNALLTSIAPTGTISLFAGNVSSGIEPVFALSYTRKVLLRDGSTFEEEVSDYALGRFREQFGPDALLPDTSSPHKI
jgi:ribonucleoside-diphosphate reductase alpha chain